MNLTVPQHFLKMNFWIHNIKIYIRNIYEKWTFKSTILKPISKKYIYYALIELFYHSALDFFSLHIIILFLIYGFKLWTMNLDILFWKFTQIYVLFISKNCNCTIQNFCKNFIFFCSRIFSPKIKTLNMLNCLNFGFAIHIGKLLEPVYSGKKNIF